MIIILSFDDLCRLRDIASIDNNISNSLIQISISNVKVLNTASCLLYIAQFIMIAYLILACVSSLKLVSDIIMSFDLVLILFLFLLLLIL